MPEWPRHLNEEVRQHLDDRYAELRAAGMPDADATRLVLAELEGARHSDLAEPPLLERVEAGTASPGLLRGLSGDLRFAWRMIAKTPGFAAVVVLTLALGIGANTAIFSVVNAILLRPLPFRDPERLVRVFQTYSKMPEGIEGLSPADFIALRDGTRAFENVAMYSVPNEGFTFTEGDRAEHVYGVAASADFFTVLGVPPLLGQTFQRGDDAAGKPPEAVISYGFWQRELGGDPHVVGRSVRFAGRTMPVIGVMPAGFWYPRGDRADVWIAMTVQPPHRQGPWGYSAIGRVRAGATESEVAADLDRAAAAVQQQSPSVTERWTMVTRPLQYQLVRDMRPVLLLLLASVGLVLAIACVNVTNLMLARASVREREMAVRAALGASRFRIIRQMVTESAVLAGAGALAGVLLARWLVAAMVALTPANFQMLRDAAITADGRVLAVTALVSFAGAMCFGIAPALVAFRSSLAGVVTDGSRGATGAPTRRRLLMGLVVAEFALSGLLLVGAGLVARSLLALESVSPGIRPDHVLTASIALPGARYDTQEKISGFFDRWTTGVRNLPGVDVVALGDGLPPGFGVGATDFHVDGQPVPEGQVQPIAESPFVDGAYFRALGIPLISGRLFDARETPASPNVVIINQTLARRFFGSVDPVGRALVIGGNPPSTIVGVVGDVKYTSLDVSDDITLYVPITQNPVRGANLVVRTRGNPIDLLPSIRAELAKIDPEIALGRTRTMDELLSDSVERPRFRATLLLAFAGVALLLAAVGIYGVMAYSVAQRTREMGVRLAIGAQPSAVTKLVIGEGVRLAAIGVGIGLVAAAGVTRLMAGLLFGVQPIDPPTFAVVAALMILVALVACWIPARRATRADPLMALRSE
jgi:putative ABC transport system permease protein